MSGVNGTIPGRPGQPADWSVKYDKTMPALRECPPGCVEHYVTGDDNGWVNHSTALRTVTGNDVHAVGKPIEVSCWMEQRDHRGDEPSEVVGVIEKLPGDVELSAVQLRELARHLEAVAEEVDEAQVAIDLAAAPVDPVIARVSAFSENVPDRIEVQVRAKLPGEPGEQSRQVLIGAGMEELMIDPVAARQLGRALIRAAG